MPKPGDAKKGKQRVPPFYLLAERAQACFGIIQEGRFVYVNRYLASLTGYHRSELLAARIEDFAIPDRWPAVDERLRQGLAGQVAFTTFELPLRSRSGDEIHLDFSASLTLYRGRPALIGVACDVTARQRSEEALREREDRYRTLFESLQETFACDELVVDAAGHPVDWRILDVNPAYERTFGCTRLAVVGRLASDVYGTDTVAAYLPLFRRVVETGEPQRFDYLFGENTFLVSVFSLGDRRLGTLGLDITELRRAQKEREQLLAQVERRVAESDAIINAIADALIIYGPSGEIVRMNPVAERVFRYSPAERAQSLAARGAGLSLETVEGKPLALEETPFWRALRGETVSGFVLRCHRDHRQPFWVSISAAPVITAGERTGAVMTVTDITSLRELQEQRQIYLSMISHDLRSPLTVILGHAQLLDAYIDKPEFADAARSSVDAILQSSHSMGAMIDALVDSAYYESGQLTLRQEPTLLDVFVRDLLQRERLVFGPEQIATDFPEDLPPVHADPVRLERILLNLLSNAVKYSPPGAPIRVHGWRVEKMVAVAVQDRGRGIAPDDLPHIFERFHRTREGRRGKGIGLGLYIARFLVEAHGGSIRVASTPGEGSTFVFTLPMAGGGDDEEGKGL